MRELLRSRPLLIFEELGVYAATIFKSANLQKEITRTPGNQGQQHLPQDRKHSNDT